MCVEEEGASFGSQMAPQVWHNKRSCTYLEAVGETRKTTYHQADLRVGLCQQNGMHWSYGSSLQILLHSVPQFEEVAQAGAIHHWNSSDKCFRPANSAQTQATLIHHSWLSDTSLQRYLEMKGKATWSFEELWGVQWTQRLRELDTHGLGPFLRVSVLQEAHVCWLMFRAVPYCDELQATCCQCRGSWASGLWPQTR